MENNLVEIVNNQVVVSSRQVAEKFGKEHKNVLRDIRGLLKIEHTPQGMFMEHKYIHEQNGQEYIEYLMGKDGFSLLAMGFTGNEAVEWKLKYIEAFNKMEKQLQQNQLDSYQIEDPVERAKKWIEEQEERQRLSNKIEADKPKVTFAEAVETSKTSILIGDLAKIIKQNGYDIGQKRLFAYLREKGYLIKRKGADYNSPTQKAMDLELFEIKEKTIVLPNQSVRIYKTTKVTGKGQIYFINEFKNVANGKLIA